MASTLNHSKALLVLNGLKHVGPIMLRRSSAQVYATLMGLELKRLVAKRADGYFEAH